MFLLVHFFVILYCIVCSIYCVCVDCCLVGVCASDVVFLLVLFVGGSGGSGGCTAGVGNAAGVCGGI